MPPTVELEQVRSGAAGRQALWHAVRLTWHGQKWAGSGSRMQRGSTVGLPGVAGRSWPCPPLDLLRSPAGGVESTRFPKCVLPLSLPFFSALRDRHPHRTWTGRWRRCVSVYPCRCGSERARHGRMAGTRAESQHRRRSDGKELFTRPPNIEQDKSGRDCFQFSVFSFQERGVARNSDGTWSLCAHAHPQYQHELILLQTHNHGSATRYS